MTLKDKLIEFKNNPEWKIIVVYWPTASWKSDLAIDIARFIDSEIISTDSQQIFTWLDIWTWKVTPEEMALAKHYMIDITTPDNSYSVWDFKEEAEKIIEEIYKKWKCPILAWWTWLYIDSLIYWFNVPWIPSSEKLRLELEEFRQQNWNEKLWEKLNEIDGEYAKELHMNNYIYVMRALEVKILTWKSKKEFRQEKNLKKDVLFITPYAWNREALYDRIWLRVEKMFEKWLLEEVKNLLEKYSKDDFWMKSIWYKEVCDYISWEITLEEAKELVKKNSRNYAKRQLTWFNKYDKYTWKVFKWMSWIDWL